VTPSPECLAGSEHGPLPALCVAGAAPVEGVTVATDLEVRWDGVDVCGEQERRVGIGRVVGLGEIGGEGDEVPPLVGDRLSVSAVIEPVEDGFEVVEIRTFPSSGRVDGEPLFECFDGIAVG